MHIEIHNCFSFWVTSVPQTPAQDVPHILYQVYARVNCSCTHSCAYTAVV